MAFVRSMVGVALLIIVVCSLGAVEARGAGGGGGGGTRNTHADLVKAVTSTCSLVLSSDVTLTANLPDVDTTACPEVKIVGACRKRQCKIDGAGKYSFLRGGITVRLENLWLTKMRCSGADNAPVVFKAGHVFITGCRVTHNVNAQDTGALSAYEGRITVEKTVFEHNQGRIGGAILLDSFSTLVATDVSFGNNKAAKGGAIFNIESDVQCTRCQFLHNLAGDGGALYFQDNDGTEGTFKNSQFIGNKATRAGGMGGAVYIHNIDPGAKFCNCEWDRNTVPGTGPRSRAPVVQHLYIHNQEEGTISFCPARPLSGVVIEPPATAVNVKDDCASGC
ncbi:hypothetical protein CBR_g36407 [Chara braunii]|uniref:Right handed beta helix domain-containing protein n=1 Tax=Chara braunii TaxID=69332 RepID=A0A388LKV1_CHABU|nr:hypothetical protein CBR_g36407 [Chara braunii]|eukprot:GBG82881.1 hypothetical protein CBR_g36407 [Chara braunii]